MTKKQRGNLKNGKRLLRKLKSMYGLSWPQIGQVFNLKSSRICDLYGDNNISVSPMMLYLIIQFNLDKDEMDKYKSFIQDTL